MGQGTIDGTTAGALMAAAAKTLGHSCYIEFSLAAQTQAKTAVGKLAEKSGYFDFSDGEDVIHETFAIFFLRSIALHLLLRYPGPADVAFGVEITQRFSQQPHLGHGMGKINVARAMRGIGTGEHRAGEAAMQAVSSPLLETSMDGARSILLSITGGEDLSLWEVNEAAKAVSAAAHPDANIIFGATVDEKLSEQVWVTVVATGYGDRGRRKSLSRLEGTGEVRVKRAAPAPLRRGDDLDVPEFLPGR